MRPTKPQPTEDIVLSAASRVGSFTVEELTVHLKLYHHSTLRKLLNSMIESGTLTRRKMDPRRSYEPFVYRVSQ